MSRMKLGPSTTSASVGPEGGASKEFKRPLIRKADSRETWEPRRMSSPKLPTEGPPPNQINFSIMKRCSLSQGGRAGHFRRGWKTGNRGLVWGGLSPVAVF